MTLLLTHDDVLASVTMRQAIEAMEAAFKEEGAGGVILPTRINLIIGNG